MQMHTTVNQFKRNKLMNKLLIAVAATLVIGINAMLPEDCYTDNGKKITNCAMVDGKAIYR